MAEHEQERSELDLDEAELEADTLKVPDEEESTGGGQPGEGASADPPTEDPAEDAMGEAAGDTLKDEG